MFSFQEDCGITIQCVTLEVALFLFNSLEVHAGSCAAKQLRFCYQQVFHGVKVP